MFENQNEKQARERKNLLKKATVSHMLPVIMDMKRW